MTNTITLSKNSAAIYNEFLQEGIAVAHIEKNEDLALWMKDKNQFQYIGRRANPFDKDAGNDESNVTKGFANPYAVSTAYPKDGTRREVVENYALHLRARQSLHKKLDGLKGKILFCHCSDKPGVVKSRLCHGHIIKEAALGNIDLNLDVCSFSKAVANSINGLIAKD